jgi:hypothetical protein
VATYKSRGTRRSKVEAQQTTWSCARARHTRVAHRSHRNSRIRGSRSIRWSPALAAIQLGISCVPGARILCRPFQGPRGTGLHPTPPLPSTGQPSSQVSQASQHHCRWQPWTGELKVCYTSWYEYSHLGRTLFTGDYALRSC